MTSMMLFRLLVFICIAVLSVGSTLAFVVGPTAPRSLVRPPLLLASSSSSSSTTEYDMAMDETKAILNRAAESKKEDPELVMKALLDLEKIMRQKAKADPKTTAEQMLSSLNGNWRLVFTTGTADTQKKIQGKINYFPLKAVQSFDTTQDPMIITNAIYLGEDWIIVKFSGTFDFDFSTRKLEFDFDEIALFGGLLRIPLAAGQAAQIGASSGLGSQSNVENAKRKRQAFFNWISADDTIATARGGGGGLALWKRTTE